MMALFVLLCSCAGMGTQQLIEVQDHNVSFMSPPSSWKKLYSAKSNKLPTGEVVSGEVFSVAWSRADSAAIMFLSTKLAALPKKQDNTSALRHMIYYRAEQFEQDCDSVSQSIESESEGTLKGKTPYNKIEASVECNRNGSYYAEKWTYYIIESNDYFYMTGITAPSDKHAWYLKDFNQFLDGVNFDAGSGQTVYQITRDSNVVKAIICPLGDDEYNLEFTKKVKKMIDGSGQFQATIDKSKTSNMLFSLWSDGDYAGVGNMASDWFASDGAEVLFYGKHVNSHTFYLGYFIRSTSYSSSASIIQMDAFNYNPRDEPTPGLMNKLKYVRSIVP